MPHDPRRVDETRAWFIKASDDLSAAALGLTADPPLVADVVFHAQQAAEKAIKGYLIKKEAGIDPGHLSRVFASHSDASLVYLAQRDGLETVSTLDEHFHAYRLDRGRPPT